jgi:hypothetical protein
VHSLNKRRGGPHGASSEVWLLEQYSFDCPGGGDVLPYFHRPFLFVLLVFLITVAERPCRVWMGKVRLRLPNWCWNQRADPQIKVFSSVT